MNATYFQAEAASPQYAPEELIAHYQRIRAVTAAICAPLAVDDYQIQSITETSPPKWHLAHVSWFFETFLLRAFEKNFQPYCADYAYLFNSYYQSVGDMQPRPQRGLLSRPTVQEIYAYRAAVDERMLLLLDGAPAEKRGDIALRTALGLHHEQQHQELLFMDIKHNFSVNPLFPAYIARPQPDSAKTVLLGWEEREGGLLETGFGGAAFAYDNEQPRHKVWLEPHRLANRLSTNAEYLEFITDGGYQRPELWLADGWNHIRQHGWQHPLYWRRVDGRWHEFTLHGLEPLNPEAPVCHSSYYEADAFARWAGKRLPLEAELESRLLELEAHGHFSDSGIFHPQPGGGQWYGTLWEWSASPYTAYPGFRPLAGSMGEYNGKFMCNQWVLRGGACVTPPDHIRPTYRNFFYPHDRWQFSGIRLAEDI
ncbi:MAG: ergothioneine biosynthesis protein EgtB [Gammaproteobacteria bacterium]|nr:ergothioneine biosynthesis protein EgtB [Gammaproteobacteria bacterium]MBU1722851.1 ergothioneine biosynthesis protein EgtB [Gammaproteobacteria bacterium]MBU2005921.1 ergothioneine biosynthesis protein EgtB [Gammaproteobacteria bacterium]